MSENLPPETPASPLLHRAGGALLLFSATAAGLLGLSTMLLLPRLTQVDIAGHRWKAEAIVSEQQKLAASVETQEEQRRDLLLAVHDPLYRALLQYRFGQTNVVDVLTQIQAQVQAVGEGKDVITLQSVQVSLPEKLVTLEGDVHSVELRSMTVLAQFVEALGRLPSVASVKSPAFTRVDDTKTGPHSPFSFSLTLR